MEQTFIQNIDDLKLTVKINSSFPYETLEAYLNDAFEKYLLPYIGEELATKLSDSSSSVQQVINARTLAMRALGPLAVSMAIPELGIMISDSGHKVARDDKYTVANDEKISEAASSMQERGWNNIDRLLNYLDDNLTVFPEWKSSQYYQSLSSGHYLNSAREFQDYGLVNINYSALAFLNFRPIIAVLERKLSNWIGESLNNNLLSDLKTTDTVKKDLIALIREWIAMNVAKVYTSQTTRIQRSAAGTPEFHPVIYPLYSDQNDNGNFYAEQVASLESSITNELLTNAAALGIGTPEAIDFNSEEKHIFVF